MARGRRGSTSSDHQLIDDNDSSSDHEEEEPTTSRPQNDGPMPSISISIHLLSLALCLSSGFQQGYIASVLNQPYKQIEDYINSSWVERFDEPIPQQTLYFLWSFLNVCFPIATIFGQFLAAIMCKRLGRKKTALIASFAYIPGILLSSSAKYLHPMFELLFIGRIIWSMANGINSVNATVWIVECAPPRIRGRMAAMQEFFMAIGSLVTQAVGVPFSTETLWPMTFLPNLVVVIISLIMFAVVYESPQFIMEHENDPVKARKALAAYHGVSVNDASVDAEMRICEESVNQETPKKKTVDTGFDVQHDGIAIMFKPWIANDDLSKVIRQAAWLGVMVKIAYVFTGARCLRAYSTFILHDMSHWSYANATWGSFIIGLLRVPFTLIPVFLVDSLGRRPLMVGSTAISAAALVIMVVAIDVGDSFMAGSFIGLTILLLITACGIGSISRFYSAELVPRHLLLSSVSMLTMFEALTKIVVEFLFYPLANWIHGQSLLIFLAPTLVFLVIIWAFCPETSRRTVNEVLNDVAKRKNLKIDLPM